MVGAVERFVSNTHDTVTLIRHWKHYQATSTHAAAPKVLSLNVLKLTCKSR